MYGDGWMREFPSMTRVLIAVDDTEHSLRAASTARTLFGDDAEYFVITVLDSAPMWWGSDEAMRWGVAYPAAIPSAGMAMPYPLIIGSGAVTGEPGAQPRNTLDEAEDVASSVANAAHIPAATAIGDTGDPAPAILQAADDHQVDVIVVGSSHAGWFSRLFSRPVADGVLRGAERAVLVVP